MKIKINLYVTLLTFFASVHQACAQENSDYLVFGIFKNDTVGVSKIESDQRFDEILQSFIPDFYNSPAYATKFSSNGKDLINLLSVINRQTLGDESVVYAYSVLKLFNDKIKQCEIIDISVATEILETLPKLLGEYFDENQRSEIEILETIVKNSFFRALNLEINKNFWGNTTNYFNTVSFEDFSKVISQDVSQFISYKSDYIENRQRLRSMTVRFLENLLNKTIWTTKNNSDPACDNFISSINSIDISLLNLAQAGILDHIDDLDSLKWSLVHRASYFVDLINPSADFCNAIATQITKGAMPLLDDEEQDRYITTKREIFVDALTKARIKALANV